MLYSTCLGNFIHIANKYLLLKVNNHGYLCTALKSSCCPNSIDLIYIYEKFIQVARVELALLFEWISVECMLLEHKNVLSAKLQLKTLCDE